MKKVICVITLFNFGLFGGILKQDFAVVERNTCKVLGRIYGNAYYADFAERRPIIVNGKESSGQVKVKFLLKNNIFYADRRAGQEVNFIVSKKRFIHQSDNVLIFFSNDCSSLLSMTESQLLQECMTIDRNALYDSQSGYTISDENLLKRIEARELYFFSNKPLYEFAQWYNPEKATATSMVVGLKSRKLVEEKCAVLINNGYDFKKAAGWSNPPYNLTWLQSLPLSKLVELFYAHCKKENPELENGKNQEAHYLNEQFRIAEKYKFIFCSNKFITTVPEAMIIKQAPIECLLLLYGVSHNLERRLGSDNCRELVKRYEDERNNGVDLNKLFLELKKGGLSNAE